MTLFLQRNARESRAFTAQKIQNSLQYGQKLEQLTSEIPHLIEIIH